MPPFNDAMEAALADVDKDQNSGPEQSDTPEVEAKTEEIAENSEPEAKAETPQDILDLAKLGKFKVEGEEMSYDDLKRAFLRQQDYTKKTQALAEERKFFDNLDADLEAVKKNPNLIAQFKQIYPEKFHRYLRFAQEEQAKIEAQSSPDSKPPAPQLPPELLERIERNERMAIELQEKHQASTRKSLETTFQSIESDVQKKYPNAELTQVYAALADRWEREKVSAEKLLENKEDMVKLFEQYAKASEEAENKKYEARKKVELEKVKAANSKAQDIGAGGGTPSSAPKSYVGKGMFQRIADEVIANETN